jgi:hypothetical protein
MSADQTLIKNNLKFLKIDIWIHSILLVLGVLIPLSLFIWSFTLSDENLNPNSYSSFSDRENTVILAFFILLFAGIISIIWQIISWFINLNFKENYTHKTHIVRKTLLLYYTFLLPSIFLLPLLFLTSPIFWLIYYFDLFSQKKNLEKLIDQKV